MSLFNLENGSLEEYREAFLQTLAIAHQISGKMSALGEGKAFSAQNTLRQLIGNFDYEKARLIETAQSVPVSGSRFGSHTNPVETAKKKQDAAIDVEGLMQTIFPEKFRNNDELNEDEEADVLRKLAETGDITQDGIETDADLIELREKIKVIPAEKLKDENTKDQLIKLAEQLKIDVSEHKTKMSIAAKISSELNK
jgi:hypothetical protein